MFFQVDKSAQIKWLFAKYSFCLQPMCSGALHGLANDFYLIDLSDFKIKDILYAQYSDHGVLYEGVNCNTENLSETNSVFQSRCFARV